MMVEDAVPCVLLVDDEPSILDLLELSLEDEYRTIVGQSGEEALELIDESVDVVLLDRRMPVMSGDEVLEAIRNRGYDVPVAMLTAVRPGIDLIDQGFDDYLVKPVGMETVHACIERLHALGRSDEIVREYYAVSAKGRAIESGLSLSELLEDEQYAALVDRQSQLEEDAHAHLEAVPGVSLEPLLNDRTVPPK